MSDSIFPHINESIENFLFDEEGNIPRSKIIAIGSMLVVMGILMTEDIYAAHRTHSTHRTHSSHRNNGHTTHYSHTTHSSHVSSTHSTHSNHSNHASHASHSNSVGLTPPTTIQAPYNIANKENALLGTHTAVTSSGDKYTANNLDITKIKK
mgnify:CR=1 FL=1